jgi:uncharacterized membrane protein
MSDQEFGSTPVEASSEPAWGAPPAGYVPPPPPPPGYAAAPASGISDNLAGALAYVTIIPAILFLLIEPYNQKPFVKFHAIQCLGLAVTGFLIGLVAIIPILGWLVFIVGWIALVVTWILCVVKAFGGGAFKIPVIGKFASEQSGYIV